jgi:exopolysaccharide biosynthesis polyprenyl glycosylphosphotransferase
MNRIIQKIKYVSFDLTTSATAWTLFYVYRKVQIDSERLGYRAPITFDGKYFLTLFFLPLFWVFLYYLNGYYNHIYRKSRLNELAQTFLMSALGVIILFFILLLDDFVKGYENYYRMLFTLFSLHFFITYIPRLILTTRTNHKIHNRKISFETLIIGSNEKALHLYERLDKSKYSTGARFVGFVSVYDKMDYQMSKHLAWLGDLSILKRIIIEKRIQEVIIAVESHEHDQLEKIINKLQGFDMVTIRAIADNCDIVSGRVKLNSLYDEPLMQISHELMPAWQIVVKRFIDVIVSVLVLICCSPLYLFLAIGVRLSSKGNVFYSHERIGKHGKPFKIYKFRSMKQDAEKSGPALSGGELDPRITKFGHFMRKSRLDEIPQFWNVLIGDMSLVGPRPERQFFIDQIVERAPHYNHLHKVRPGITSWGQVKYGYAKDVDEMIERLNYDIIYIENMSLYNDVKILIYTVKTVLLGKGI